MKTHPTNANEPYSLDPSRLDRLVDGELEPLQRQEVIRQLDESPDGWRRCALTFLEAQAFREAFGEMASEAGASSQGVVDAGVRRASRGAWRGLAVAAGLVVAFGLGLVVAPQGGKGGSSEPPPLASEGATASPSQGLIVEGEGRGGAAEEFWVPVVEAEEGDPMWRWLQESLATEDMIARLEAEGHYVSKTRQLVPITLPDGRQAVLPIDEVEVRPVVYRTYR
jgi:hypothetical protein